MYHVLLYYKFTRVADPASEVKLHTEVCRALQLKGRILMNQDGINGTVGGSPESIVLYRAYMDQHRDWRGIDFKLSESAIEPFHKLKVRFRPEIITTEAGGDFSLCNRGQHVDRDTFHAWLERGEDMVLLDMRNEYEWEVGRFVNSVRPPMKYFRDLKNEMDFYEKFRGQKIVMFCTGGIRCEPASAYFIAHGFDPKNIFQLEGGIVKYAEKYGDAGFFEGKCFVFDERLAVPVNTSASATVVGHCFHCQGLSDLHRNCANKWCNKLFLACDGCAAVWQNTCSAACREVAIDPTNCRPAHGNDVRVLHRNK